MKKKLQVFISSTYLDLEKERQEAVQSILEFGHIPAGMELFAAGDTSQKEAIRSWIKKSDVYLLILGGRYGSIDPETEKSYTHWEYEFAGEVGIPRLALVLSDNYINELINTKALKAESIELSLPLYKDFKSLVSKSLYKIIDHISGIKGAIMSSLQKLIDEDKVKGGWIRYQEALDSDKYFELLDENTKLKEKIAKGHIIQLEQNSKLAQGDDIISINVSAEHYTREVKKDTDKKQTRKFSYESIISENLMIPFNAFSKPLLLQLGTVTSQSILKSEVITHFEELIIREFYEQILSKRYSSLQKNDSYYYNRIASYSNDTNKSTNFSINFDLNVLLLQFKLLDIISFSISENGKQLLTLTEYGIEVMTRELAILKKI